MSDEFNASLLERLTKFGEEKMFTPMDDIEGDFEDAFSDVETRVCYFEDDPTRVRLTAGPFTLEMARKDGKLIAIPPELKIKQPK